MAAAPPDAHAEDALVPLSALQHYLFCPRQCALIHLEQIWQEDAATAEGRLLHDRADTGGPETRPGIRVAMLRVDDPAFGFGGRSRRPPLDRVNVLLSFLHAMLGHDCRSALEAHGLDPQVGFLHADRPGRASLALDLMEELRPVLADRLALTLVNRRQLALDDFVQEDAGGVRLTDAARKRVLVAWQERKRDELRHPFLDETMPLGLVAHAQAQLLARCLRGDLDGYPAFVWK